MIQTGIYNGKKSSEPANKLVYSISVLIHLAVATMGQSYVNTCTNQKVMFHCELVPPYRDMRILRSQVYINVSFG